MLPFQNRINSVQLKTALDGGYLVFNLFNLCVQLYLTPHLLFFLQLIGEFRFFKLKPFQLFKLSKSINRPRFSNIIQYERATMFGTVYGYNTLGK